jgi:hypothetical protein
MSTASVNVRSAAMVSTEQPALFAGYPPAPKKKAKPQCCDHWTEFLAEREERHQGVHLIWRAAHGYAHGRVPFSIGQLAVTAHSTERNALGVIERAVELNWIAPVLADRFRDAEGEIVPLWVGRLKGRR